MLVGAVAAPGKEDAVDAKRDEELLFHLCPY
jgi:hypothetical protein